MNLGRAAIFDLDGTLIDTLDDIASAMNAALSGLGAPALSVESYRRLVGQGLEILAEKALPEKLRDAQTIARCVTAMRREYAHCYAEKTKPYAGIHDLLLSLEGRGVKTAVLSNKADEFSKKIVSHFFPDYRFELVLGKSSDFPMKPDPAAALHIAKTLDIPPQECVFIGDSDIDMQTAVNAGMFPLGVLWGFRSARELRAGGAQLLVHTPAEIFSFLSR